MHFYINLYMCGISVFYMCDVKRHRTLGCPEVTQELQEAEPLTGLGREPWLPAQHSS